MSINLVSYNNIMRILYIIVDRTIFRPKGVPHPKEFQYVLIDGQKMPSYPFLVNTQFSINLLLNCSFVAVDIFGDVIEGLKVEMKFARDISEIMNIEYNNSICTLAELYNSISKKREFYGILFNNDWPDEANYEE